MGMVHLHAHSYYSLLDGLQPADEMGKTVAARGMNAVALTDHGYMGGIPEFVKGCRTANVKPIIGNETYLAFGDAKTKSDFMPENGVAEKAVNNGHFLLLAKNEEGYKNLMKLTKYSYEDGFYRYPRIDLDTFKQHAKGLIATSTCISSQCFKYWHWGEHAKIDRWCDEVREAVGDDSFFLELQHNNVEKQYGYNQYLIDLSKRKNIPLVLTADAHHQNQDQYKLRSYVMCVSMHKTPDTMPYEVQDHNAWMYDAEFAKTLCDDWQLPYEAITNTQHVADLVDGDYFERVTRAPNLQLEGMTPEGTSLMLLKKAKAGLISRLGVKSWTDVPKAYKDRIKYEFQVIDEARYSSYFLVVQDYVSLAKGMGIPVGPARGSGGGSLISWSLGITAKHLDPVKHGLLFERFLNPGRVRITLDYSEDIKELENA